MTGENEHVSQPKENKEEKRRDIRGLRIRNANRVFIVALSALAVILFVVSLFVSSEYREITQIADDYRRIEHDAKLVQAASDDLTRDVELFVMTGDKHYVDDYFNEANVARRREYAMADLSQLHVTDAMFRHLESAVNESVHLMELEYDAIRYAAEGYGRDELSTFPQVIREQVLPGIETLSAEEKIQKAQEIVFGENYRGYKNRITDYQERYLTEATELMESVQSGERRTMNWLMGIQWASIVLVVLFGLSLYFFISRLVVRPLGHAVACMARGERVSDAEGVYEVQYMTHYYNAYHDDSVSKQKLLKQDAERDGLTGVLNRRGYQTVIEKLASETFPLAFLVVDIDNFKRVNDTCGHEIGDAVLKKLADLLRSTFRETDITSRIGGDEFAVIVLDVTEDSKGIIEEKIGRINKALQNPGQDGCPAITASVGCAFSHAGYNNFAFAQADKKMYEAKHEGGGCKIYFA